MGLEVLPEDQGGSMKKSALAVLASLVFRGNARGQDLIINGGS